MENKLSGELIAAARQYAPAVSEAVSGVEDDIVKAAIAGELFRRLLGEVQVGSPLADVGGKGNPKIAAPGKILNGTQGRVADLIENGFFDEPRNVAAVEQELRLRGFYHNNADTRMSLLRLARKKILRRLPAGGGRTFNYVKF